MSAKHPEPLGAKQRPPRACREVPTAPVTEALKVHLGAEEQVWLWQLPQGVTGQSSDHVGAYGLQSLEGSYESGRGGDCGQLGILPGGLGTAVRVGDHSWRRRWSSDWSWLNGSALDDNSPGGSRGYSLGK